MVLDALIPQIALDSIGYVATVIGCVAAVPQLIVSIKSKNTKNLSLMMILMMIFGNVCWMTYGILCGIFPMIIGNIIVIPLWITLLVLKICGYRKKDTNIKE